MSHTDICNASDALPTYCEERVLCAGEIEMMKSLGLFQEMSDTDITLTSSQLAKLDKSLWKSMATSVTIHKELYYSTEKGAWILRTCLIQSSGMSFTFSSSQIQQTKISGESSGFENNKEQAQP